jgi:glyoxylase-like metal-dependent hydrolase (beta-lactamase superfamily II)
MAGLVCGLVSAGVVAAGSPGETAAYSLVEVSPSVVMAYHDNGSNISCIAADDGLIFVDASLSTTTARHFRRTMEARFDRPTRALVVTHAHLDHVLGMAAFGDVPVFAARAGRPRWEHLVALEWDERALAGYGSIYPTLSEEIVEAELRLPTNWFDDEFVIGPAVVTRTGGHTVDSSSVVVAEESVVIAGDLVQARRRPYFGEPDTDFVLWIDTLRHWEGLEAGSVCPGHGPVIDVDELGRIRAWFEAVSASVSDLKSRGLSVEEVFVSDELPAGYWPDEETVPRWWGTCVKQLYDAS